MAKYKIDHALMKDLESRTFDNIAELSKYLREKSGLKRATLARLIGFDKRYGAFIQQVEERINPPSVRMLRAYTQYFKICPEYVCSIDKKEIESRVRKYLDKRYLLVSGGICGSRKPGWNSTPGRVRIGEGVH